jgi:hypothetical protein
MIIKKLKYLKVLVFNNPTVNFLDFCIIKS